MKPNQCASHYFGSWLIEPRWFAGMVQLFNTGQLPRVKFAEHVEVEEESDRVLQGPNGTAIIPLQGHLMKSESSFGGTATVQARRDIRQAAADPAVSGIMLFIDSPGGTAEGTFELSEEVRKARETKPVRAHIEDLGASAAFFVASQADRITANRMALVGSIGTIGVLVDSSGAAEKEGLQVHVISTGEFKGAGVPGTKVTDRQLAVFQEEVDDLNSEFLDAVSRGRGLTGARLAAVATGRTWIASRAEALGLIDDVTPWEEAITDFATSLPERGNTRTAIALAQTKAKLSRFSMDLRYIARNPIDMIAAPYSDLS